jgi:hypothetical protein
MAGYAAPKAMRSGALLVEEERLWITMWTLYEKKGDWPKGWIQTRWDELIAEINRRGLRPNPDVI